MLDELAISNLGLIESVAVQLRRGLVVVSGETGAGKTMLIGGFRLLLGEQARRQGVGPHGPEATVEGRFIVDGEEIVGRRVVTHGRSRAYLNGSLATAEELSTALDGHVDIVAQHDQMSLRRPAFVRTLLDRGLDEPGVAALESYTSAHERWAGLRQAADELGGDRRSLERDAELAAHQATEIESAQLTPGLEAELLDEVSRLRNREELLERFERSRRSVESARDAVGAALDEIRRAAELDHRAAETATLLGGAAAELAEVDGGIRSLAEDMPHDASELAAMESRLAQIGDLKRKYGDTVEDVMAFGKDASARSVALVALLERAETLAQDLAAAEAATGEAGAVLREARRQAGLSLAEATERHLRDMGMPDPVVRFEVEEAAPGAHGADRCELRFASDARLDPGPVHRVASGGELSRLVLALRLAAGADETPVLVFDEIDAGVGGETGLAVGRKLASLARSGQVFCVTHLPQVAAFADQHLVVERNDTTSIVRDVTTDDRPAELARMLSGMSDSHDAQRHAAELIEAAGRSGG